MKSTLADVRQLFNVKAIAYNTSADALTDGQFGIFAEGSTTSIPNTVTSFADLPQKFKFISKVGGKTYFTADYIDKDTLKNQKEKAYTAQQVNIWSAIIENCDCMKSVLLKINIDEDSLIRRDGLTWTHSDFVIELSPKELECLCDCTGKGVYENHVMTKLFFDKIQALNSPFYEAEVQDESGNVLADSAAIQAFIDANQADNTDDDETNDSEKLVLFLKGKAQPAPNYKDLEVNYIYPRGVKLNPAIIVNDETGIAFTQVQTLGFEQGSGYDMRAEEFDCMSLYTTLNFYPQLSDGIASGELVYQFENGVNYDTLTFEFTTDKVERNNGDKRLFGVLLGSETGNGVIDDLADLLIP